MKPITKPSIELALAALLGGLAVMAGAFGAHGLEAAGDQRAIELVETASHYQLTHALAALLAGLLLAHSKLACRCFLAGILLFCGSLYALALGAPSFLGAVAPIGGLLLIAGWLVLAWRLVSGRPVTTARRETD